MLMDPRNLPRHGFDADGPGFFEWLFPQLVAAFLIAIVGLLIYALARRPGWVAPAGGEPAQLAAARLATGDIKLSEFDDIRTRVEEPASDVEEGPGNEPGT